MDEGLSGYAVMVEGLSVNVYDFVTYIVVTCDDDTYVAAAERVMNRKCLQATIAFSLKVRGVAVITCT